MKVVIRKSNLHVFDFTYIFLLKIAVNNNSAIFTNVLHLKNIWVLPNNQEYILFVNLQHMLIFGQHLLTWNYIHTTSNFHYIPHIFGNNVHFCCMNIISSHQMLIKIEQLLTKNQQMLQVDEKYILICLCQDVFQM